MRIEWGPLSPGQYYSFTVTRVLYFAQLTNRNFLGELSIRDANNREIGNCYLWIWQIYNTHARGCEGADL
jgi:hypothetical protein